MPTASSPSRPIPPVPEPAAGRRDEPAAAASVDGAGRFPSAVAVSIHVCAFVLGVGALGYGRDFFLPVALGFLFALTLIPIVRWLSRRGIPAGFTAIGLVLLLAAGIGTASYFLSGPVTQWINEAPQIGRQIESKLRSLRGSVEAVAEATKKVEELSQQTADPAVQQVVIREPGFLSSATSNLWSGVTTIGVALLLVLFLLASGDMFYEKIVRVLPTLSDKKKAVRIVHDIEDSVSRYLLTVTLINLGLGVAVTALMWALGMPNPYVWGAAATVLNYLPFLGAAAGVIMTGLVAFITFETPVQALVPPLAYLALTAVEGNILTPLILGRRLELNTVAVFIAIAFWGWIWGLIGVFIAVPLLVTLKILCDHLESWSNVGEFLSSTPPKSAAEDNRDQDAINPIVKT